jgi:LEA14-like dessication related protein
MTTSRLWLLVTLLAAAGCERCTPQKPSASVAGVDVKDASLDGVVLDVDVVVDNPNAAALFADELHAVLRVSDKQAATVDLKQRVTVAAGSKGHVKVPVAVRYADVQSVVDASKGADRWPYVVDGTVGFAPVDGVVVRVPFQKSGTLVAPHLPKVSTKNARVARVTATELVVGADVIVENDNMFALPKGAMRGTVQIGAASSAVDVDVPVVAAGGVAVVKLEQAFSLARLGKAAVDVAAGRAVDVDVDVRVVIGKTTRPLRARVTVRR